LLELVASVEARVRMEMEHMTKLDAEAFADLLALGSTPSSSLTTKTQEVAVGQETSGKSSSSNTAAAAAAAVVVAAQLEAARTLLNRWCAVLLLLLLLSLS
jgi:hypothetical protein